MKPYYEDELVTIYHGDCQEVAPSLAADVVVSDPPYGLRPVNGTGYGRSRTRVAGDETTDLTEWLLAWWGGPAIVFGMWQAPAICAHCGSSTRVVQEATWVVGIAPAVAQFP